MNPKNIQKTVNGETDYINKMDLIGVPIRFRFLWESCGVGDERF